MKIRNYSKYINENNILDVYDLLLIFFEENNIRKYKDADDIDENVDENAYTIISTNNSITGYIHYIDLNIKDEYIKTEARIQRMGYNITAKFSEENIWEISNKIPKMLDDKIGIIEFKIDI